MTPDRNPAAGVNVEKAVSAILFSLTAILIVAPVGYVIYGSVRTGSPLEPDSTFTWANLAYVYGSELYRSALFNTILLSLVSPYFRSSSAAFLRGSSRGPMRPVGGSLRCSQFFH
jgi:ABC-type spermidine/putrescine transport system permease subunit II